jgi:DNA-binding NarL/FixJ family response regulator
MAIRIILVDDHQVLREGLKSLLEKHTEFEVVGEASNGLTALKLVRELMPDIVIMDVNMPEMDGIETTRLITQEFPKIRVLALSMYLRKAFVTEMFENGAAGYLLKDNTFSEVINAIKKISLGQKYVCSKVAGILVDGYTADKEDNTLSGKLTKHQIEIVRMLADGHTSKEIAAMTKTSIKTVDACRRRVLKKLGMQSFAELIKYAIREGLTTVEHSKEVPKHNPSNR